MIMKLEGPFLDQLNVCPKFFIFVDLPPYLFQFKHFAKPSCSIFTLPVKEQFICTHIWQIIAIVSLQSENDLYGQIFS